MADAPQSQPTPPAEPDAAREGHSERAGEGGYGNDTGFATGTQAPRDEGQGGLSAREEQANQTYGDAAHDAPVR